MDEETYIGDLQSVMKSVKWWTWGKIIDNCRRRVKVRVTIEVMDPEEGDVDNVDI